MSHTALLDRFTSRVALGCMIQDKRSSHTEESRDFCGVRATRILEARDFSCSRDIHGSCIPRSTFLHDSSLHVGGSDVLATCGCLLPPRDTWPPISMHQYSAPAPTYHETTAIPSITKTNILILVTCNRSWLRVNTSTQLQ